MSPIPSNVSHVSHVSRVIPSMPPRSERLPDRFVSEALGLDLREHYKQIKIARDRVMEEAEEAAVRFFCFVCFVLFALFIDLLADQVQPLSRYMPEAFLFCNPFQPREKKRKRTPKVI